MSNIYENFLKRRNLVTEDNTDQLDYKILCGKGSSVFCKLDKLIDDLDGDEYLINKLTKSIHKIYTHLRPPINDNKSKFNRLLEVIFKLDSENIVNTFSIISDSMVGIDVRRLKSEIELLTNSEIEDGEQKLREIINKIKYKSYTEYENSFIGDHFESYRSRLILKHGNESFSNLMVKVVSGEMSHIDLAKLMFESIKSNFTKDIGEFIKADLKCVSPLKDEDGLVIIDKDSFVEVKKLDYMGDSYLSEFFSIYKNPDRLPNELKSDSSLRDYNIVIDQLYTLLNRGGQDILDRIRNNFSGIIYEENRFISSDNITLYWSNKGQRVIDHRLSIRYKINSGNINTYIYNKDSDILVLDKVNTKLNDRKMVLPLTEGNIIESSDFDWIKTQYDNSPSDTRISALRKSGLLDQSEVGSEVSHERGWYGDVPVIETNGHNYVSLTLTEMGNAFAEYIRVKFTDDLDSLEYLDNEMLNDYINVDVDEYCDEHSDDTVRTKIEDDYYISDLRDEIQEYKDEHEVVLEKIEQYVEALETLEIQNTEYIEYGYTEPPHTEEEFETFELRLEELEETSKKYANEIERLEHELEITITSFVEDYKTNECLSCMREDIIYCMVDVHKTHSFYEIIESDLFDLDSFIDDYIVNSDIGDYGHELPTNDGYFKEVSLDVGNGMTEVYYVAELY